MILTLLLIFLAARLALVRRAVGRLRLAECMQGVQCDAPDRIGISLLVVEQSSCEEVLRLLAVEYVRYEVVVVLDGVRDEAFFAELQARYHLIRVEYLPTGELPIEGVVGLYRSRKRRFRRLVVVDVLTTRSVDRLNAAAEVAEGEYLLPMRRGAHLAEGVIERLAVLLGEQPHAQHLLRTTVGVPTFVCAREAVVEAGGFAHYPAHRSGERLHAPILLRTTGRDARWQRVLPVLLLLVPILLGVVLRVRWEWVAVPLLGVLLLLLAAVRIRQLTEP